MGRKANNKIKVVLQIPELTYQRIAVDAAKDGNQTVTERIHTFIDARFGTPETPLLTPPTQAPTVAPPAPAPEPEKPEKSTKKK